MLNVAVTRLHAVTSPNCYFVEQTESPKDVH